MSTEDLNWLKMMITKYVCVAAKPETEEMFKELHEIDKILCIEEKSEGKHDKVPYYTKEGCL